MAKGKAKIDQVLERLGSLEQGQQKNYDLIQKNGESIQKNYDLIQKNGESIQKNYDLIQKNGDSIQRNYDLIQKNGVTIEKVASDVKAVAEGHGVLLNKIEEVKVSIAEVDGKLEETREVVGETNRMLKNHVQQPAHAGV